MKSNYDKLYQVLRAWYTPAQIDEIWAMLKIYDKMQAASSKPQAASALKRTQLKNRVK
jgi:hypothetical protein